MAGLGMLHVSLLALLCTLTACMAGERRQAQPAKLREAQRMLQGNPWGRFVFSRRTLRRRHRSAQLKATLDDWGSPARRALPDAARSGLPPPPRADQTLWRRRSVASKRRNTPRLQPSNLPPDTFCHPPCDPAAAQPRGAATHGTRRLLAAATVAKPTALATCTAKLTACTSAKAAAEQKLGAAQGVAAAAASTTEQQLAAALKEAQEATALAQRRLAEITSLKKQLTATRAELVEANAQVAGSASKIAELEVKVRQAGGGGGGGLARMHTLGMVMASLPSDEHVVSLPPRAMQLDATSNRLTPCTAAAQTCEIKLQTCSTRLAASSAQAATCAISLAAAEASAQACQSELWQAKAANGECLWRRAGGWRGQRWAQRAPSPAPH